MIVKKCLSDLIFFCIDNSGTDKLRIILHKLLYNTGKWDDYICKNIRNYNIIFRLNRLDKFFICEHIATEELNLIFSNMVDLPVLDANMNRSFIYINSKNLFCAKITAYKGKNPASASTVKNQISFFHIFLQLSNT